MKLKIQKRIICIGNRFIPADAAGPLVFDHLKQLPLPDDTDLIDGGMAGLNLLHYLQDTRLVIFVDSVTGFKPSGNIVILEAEDIVQNVDETYSHSAGLGYLLKILPRVMDGELPQIRLVGIEGLPQSHLIEKTAEICLSLGIVKK